MYFEGKKFMVLIFYFLSCDLLILRGKGSRRTYKKLFSDNEGKNLHFFFRSNMKLKPRYDFVETNTYVLLTERWEKIKANRKVNFLKFYVKKRRKNRNHKYVWIFCGGECILYFGKD